MEEQIAKLREAMKESEEWMATRLDRILAGFKDELKGELVRAKPGSAEPSSPEATDEEDGVVHDDIADGVAPAATTTTDVDPKAGVQELEANHDNAAELATSAASAQTLAIDATGVTAPTPAICSTDGPNHDADVPAAPLFPLAAHPAESVPLKVFSTLLLQLDVVPQSEVPMNASRSTGCLSRDDCWVQPMPTLGNIPLTCAPTKAVYLDPAGPFLCLTPTAHAGHGVHLVARSQWLLLPTLRPGIEKRPWPPPTQECIFTHFEQHFFPQLQGRMLRPRSWPSFACHLDSPYSHTALESFLFGFCTTGRLWIHWQYEQLQQGRPPDPASTWSSMIARPLDRRTYDDTQLSQEGRSWTVAQDTSCLHSFHIHAGYLASMDFLKSVLLGSEALHGKLSDKHSLTDGNGRDTLVMILLLPSKPPDGLAELILMFYFLQLTVITREWMIAWSFSNIVLQFGNLFCAPEVVMQCGCLQIPLSITRRLHYCHWLSPFSFLLVSNRSGVQCLKIFQLVRVEQIMALLQRRVTCVTELVVWVIASTCNHNETSPDAFGLMKQLPKASSLELQFVASGCFLQYGPEAAALLLLNTGCSADIILEVTFSIILDMASISPNLQVIQPYGPLANNIVPIHLSLLLPWDPGGCAITLGGMQDISLSTQRIDNEGRSVCRKTGVLALHLCLPWDCSPLSVGCTIQYGPDFIAPGRIFEMEIAKNLFCTLVWSNRTRWFYHSATTTCLKVTLGIAASECYSGALLAIREPPRRLQREQLLHLYFNRKIEITSGEVTSTMAEMYGFILVSFVKKNYTSEIIMCADDISKAKLRFSMVVDELVCGAESIANCSGNLVAWKAWPPPVISRVVVFQYPASTMINPSVGFRHDLSMHMGSDTISDMVVLSEYRCHEWSVWGTMHGAVHQIKSTNKSRLMRATSCLICWDSMAFKATVWYVCYTSFRTTWACFLLDNMKHNNRPKLHVELPKGSKQDKSLCEPPPLLSVLLPTQKVELAWDPGIWKLLRFPNGNYKHIEAKGGRSIMIMHGFVDHHYHHDYTDTEEHQVPWDPGGNTLASAWGQAEF